MKNAIESAEDAGGPVGADVVAACALSSVPGLGALALSRIAELFGSLAEAMQAGPAQILLRQEEGALQLRPAAVEYLSRKPDLARLGLWAVGSAKACGARVVVLGDPFYPALLRQIDLPPALLYVRGLLPADVPRVAIVGARASDDYGLALARELAEGLASAGVQVVSGGARGVDAAAHAGALWGQGTTVAVLGCGIDLVYPPGNGPLFERLASGGGAVVSEFPPGTAPLPGNFPRRNRTISGLSSAVVVVRAAIDSGAMITANHAAQQGRPIFAVPGEAFAPLSAGPNQLLTRGAARAVTSAADVLRQLGWGVPPQLDAPPAVPLPEPTTGAAGAAPLRPLTVPGGDDQALDEVSIRLWRLLDDRRPVHLDELAARAHIAAQEALRKMQDLELRGLCFQRPGKYYLRRQA